MVGLDRITIGVDFSPGAMNAVAHAVRLAQGGAAAVQAMHAVDPLAVADLADAIHRPQDEVRADIERSARQSWARDATPFGLGGSELCVVFEAPVRALVSAAAGAGLLVLATRVQARGETGVGVTAAECARRASCSVLLVHPKATGPFRRIAVGVDFSEPSREALACAASIAAREGAELHVVHVFEGPWHKLHYRAPTPEANPEFIRNYRGTLDRMLEEMTGRIRAVVGNRPVHRHVVDAPKHGDALMAFARQHDADLIVVGASGRRGLLQFMLGSTAERICRDATTSVMVVRPVASGR